VKHFGGKSPRFDHAHALNTANRAFRQCSEFFAQQNCEQFTLSLGSPLRATL
jgi:hypothetical protein